MFRKTQLGPKRPGEYRIAHLSDLHISADRSALRHRLRSWVGQSHADNLVNLYAVMRDIATREIDHIVITGDLTNASKDEEFLLVREALGDYFHPDRLTVIPGNHDLSYRRRAKDCPPDGCPRKLGRFLSYFGDLFPHEYPRELGGGRPKHLFPLVKILGGEIALIGLDTTGRLTARAGPLNSFGTISRAQFRELRALLKNAHLGERIKIVAMHHHPMIIPLKTIFDTFKPLLQAKHLLDLLYESRVDLIIHGHKHHPFCWQSHTFRDHDITVICAGPPDAYSNGTTSNLVYNIYSITGPRIEIHYQTCPRTTRPRTRFTYTAKKRAQEKVSLSPS